MFLFGGRGVGGGFFMASSLGSIDGFHSDVIKL